MLETHINLVERATNQHFFQPEHILVLGEAEQQSNLPHGCNRKSILLFSFNQLHSFNRVDIPSVLLQCFVDNAVTPLIYFIEMLEVLVNPAAGLWQEVKLYRSVSFRPN